jgi:hypothetical protein
MALGRYRPAAIYSSRMNKNNKVKKLGTAGSVTRAV